MANCGNLEGKNCFPKGGTWRKKRKWSGHDSGAGRGANAAVASLAAIDPALASEVEVSRLPGFLR